MNQLDIPILKITFDLYKTFHSYHRIVPKPERFIIYEKGSNLILNVVELLIEASYTNKNRKVEILEKASLKLNTLRFIIRLMKDTKTFNMKQYIALQELIDETGRMLGGWIRSNTN